MGRRVGELFPEVDVVVDGYGESALVDLALGRIAPDVRYLERHASVDLDSLPIPDYQPYLRDREASGREPGLAMLAFESSRGCWWGEKHHCTFCGFNQLSRTSRSSSMTSRRT
jgi:radical SAM superfamily enzyme YgiQ (UPF0313 family)